MTIFSTTGYLLLEERSLDPHCRFAWLHPHLHLCMQNIAGSKVPQLIRDDVWCVEWYDVPSRYDKTRLNIYLPVEFQFAVLSKGLPDNVGMVFRMRHSNELSYAGYPVTQVQDNRGFWHWNGLASDFTKHETVSDCISAASSLIRELKRGRVT